MVVVSTPLILPLPTSVPVQDTNEVAPKAAYSSPRHCVDFINSAEGILLAQQLHL